jgi:hypothetical protein
MYQSQKKLPAILEWNFYVVSINEPEDKSVFSYVVHPIHDSSSRNPVKAQVLSETERLPH